MWQWVDPVRDPSRETRRAGGRVRIMNSDPADASSTDGVAKAYGGTSDHGPTGAAGRSPFRESPAAVNTRGRRPWAGAGSPMTGGWTGSAGADNMGALP